MVFVKKQYQGHKKESAVMQLLNKIKARSKGH